MLVCIKHCGQLSQLDVGCITTISVSRATPTEPQRKAPPSVVQRSSYGVHQFRSSTGSPYGLRGMTERILEAQEFSWLSNHGRYIEWPRCLEAPHKQLMQNLHTQLIHQYKAHS